MKYQKNPEWKIWLHTLSPSLASLTISVTLVVFILAFHLLLLTNNSELLVTELAGVNPDDRLTNFYVLTIQSQLNEAFGSSTLGVISTAAIWGVVGWVVYGGFDFILSNLRNLLGSSKEISAPNKNQIIKHPLMGQIIIKFMWRFTFGLIMVLWTISIQTYITGLFSRDILLITADSSAEMLTHGVIIVLGWLVIFHVYAVLLRLFVLRTRFFGEIIY